MDKKTEILIGTLSNPSKMPGYSWSISAKKCNVGSLLRTVKNSVCSKCYAFRGNYRWSVVKKAQQKRLEGLQREDWPELISSLILAKNKKYFRWFDSGDLQDLDHLKKIVRVAELCPKIKFWLPTRELGILKQFDGKYPPNLTIRYSSPTIGRGDSIKLPDSVLRSAVRHKKDKKIAGEKLCYAYKRNSKCGLCRACWNPTVKLVTYLQH